MKKLLFVSVLLLLGFLGHSQNSFVIGTEFGAKVDNYFYINELGQTFKQNYGNPTFGFSFAFQHKQHIFETGFNAYVLWDPTVDYNFVANQPQKGFSAGRSGLSDYWVPIKYGYEFAIDKKQKLFLQPGLAFNIFVGEYYKFQPDGSWGSSVLFPTGSDPYSINEGTNYTNGRTNFGFEPQFIFTYRIAKKYDIFLNTSYQFGLKPRKYDVITHTNSVTNEVVNATRSHSNSLLLRIGFKYHFIKEKTL